MRVIVLSTPLLLYHRLDDRLRGADSRSWRRDRHPHRPQGHHRRSAGPQLAGILRLPGGGRRRSQLRMVEADPTAGGLGGRYPGGRRVAPVDDLRADRGEVPRCVWSSPKPLPKRGGQWEPPAGSQLQPAPSTGAPTTTRVMAGTGPVHPVASQVSGRLSVGEPPGSGDGEAAGPGIEPHPSGQPGYCPVSSVPSLHLRR